MTEGVVAGTVLWGVVIARLLVPLTIPRWPLPGIVAALLLDGVDQTIFQVIIGGDLPGYQVYDKALDVHYLAIAYLSTIRNWADGLAFGVGRGLWYYRLVGVALFEATDQRWLLLVFPNTFEYYVIAIEAIKVAWNPFRLAARTIVAIAAGIWILIKLPQEWWIHVAKLDATDAIKEHVFGVPLSASWADAVANRPWVLLVAGLVLIGLVLAARWVAPRLPARHWEPTLSADAQAGAMGWAPPPRRLAPAAAFDRGFVEKVVLATFVTAIFGAILPGADRNIVQVGVAVAIIVAASTVISQLLARRGVTWTSTGLELLAVGVANASTVIVLGIVLPYRGGAPPIETALFLVGVITLIVVLYDRFHAIRRHRLTETTWR
ncbi:MAG TPA: hypothetical protein VHR55_10345 [Candidatus Limnocylindria bacterium]|nr:hypothetical protein [Candidatus Limnocylindria bacterium]